MNKRNLESHLAKFGGLVPPVFEEVAREAPLIRKILSEFVREDVDLSVELLKAVTNFVLMRSRILSGKSARSKRQKEKSIEFRFGTIDRIVEQMVRDKEYDDVKIEPFVALIERQLFVAVVEQAEIIHEALNQSDPRDTSALDLHIWSFRNFMRESNVKKPNEVLLSILEASGALKGIGRSKIGTLNNNLTRAQSIIDRHQANGACHVPKFFGEWPRVDSPAFSLFVDHGECLKCTEAWRRAFKTPMKRRAPLKLAVEVLSKEFRKHSEMIVAISEGIYQAGPAGLSLQGIVDRLPTKSRSTFGYLFKG